MEAAIVLKKLSDIVFLIGTLNGKASAFLSREVPSVAPRWNTSPKDYQEK